ncbi:MAG: VWA domain-containing protein [Kamptonema sp. SIO4C4]|nr:VWA domain-containing protein [Kamptonema sp. SIO4C4]
MLNWRDYTLIIDKSGSMSQVEPDTGKSRWQIMQESTLALAHTCEEADPDGITVYLFSGRFRRYDHVTSEHIERIFRENTPAGHTELAGVLDDAMHNYFQRRATGMAQPNGEAFLVVTDGTIRDRDAVLRILAETSKNLEHPAEICISFIQVGTDSQASDFLNHLDQHLEQAGVSFSFVDTVSLDKMETSSLTQELLKHSNGNHEFSG